MGGKQGLLCLQGQFGHCGFDLHFEHLNRHVSITHFTGELGFKFPRPSKKQYIRRGLSACCLGVSIPLILIWCDAFHQMCLPECKRKPRGSWSCWRAGDLDFFPLGKWLDEGIHNLKSAYRYDICYKYLRKFMQGTEQQQHMGNQFQITRRN